MRIGRSVDRGAGPGIGRADLVGTADTTIVAGLERRDPDPALAAGEVRARVAGSAGGRARVRAEAQDRCDEDEEGDADAEGALTDDQAAQDPRESVREHLA